MGLFYACKDNTHTVTLLMMMGHLDVSAIQEFGLFIYTALDQTLSPWLVERSVAPHPQQAGLLTTPKTIRCNVTHHITLTADKQRFLLPQTLKNPGHGVP